MKKTILFSIVMLLMFSCGRKEDQTPAGKKARLEALRKEQQKISAEIAQIEKELSSQEGDAGPQKQVRDVSVIQVSRAGFTHYIDNQGTVNAEQEVYVNPEMPGSVTRILVAEGSQVKAGQVIAYLDDAVIRQGIAELENQLAFAEDLFQKQKSLWDQKIGTEVQYLSAKNNKEALEKRIETTREQLKMTRIKSPISGTIDEVMIKVGQSVAPGVPCARVINLSQLKIKAHVSEVYSGKVRAGNTVRVLFPDLRKELDAKVSYVGKTINPIGRTFVVEVALRPNEQGVMPNMLATIKIADYQNANAISLPVNLIQQSNDGHFVYVARKDADKLIAHKAAIQVGKYYGDQAEVLSGLQPGDEVVSVGYQDLNEGDLLKLAGTNGK